MLLKYHSQGADMIPRAVLKRSSSNFTNGFISTIVFSSPFSDRQRPNSQQQAGPDTFSAQKNKLLASISYKAKFKYSYSTTTSNTDVAEEGYVSGAKIQWADDATLKLHRRAILSWDGGQGPRSVLIVKKPGDLAAAAKLKELGEWMRRCDIQVYVERAVHMHEAPEFEPFIPPISINDTFLKDNNSNASFGRDKGLIISDPESQEEAMEGADNNKPSSSSSSSIANPSSLSSEQHQQQNQNDQPSPYPDLCITLGGDGTVLHLASIFGDGNASPLPPVISFAMGTLGFLTPFNASMARTVLSRLLLPPWKGEPIFCTLRSRKLCSIFSSDGNLQRTHTVLNECLVDRGSTPSMVSLEVFIDGAHLTSVQADGLIISTPSGSTAYSMAAGGPMVAPSVPGTILTPVAAHSLSFRPIVVPESSVIEVHLPQDARSHARASFDGRHPTRIHKGWSVVCETAKYALPSICMHPLDEDWYEGITAKLQWTGSLRSQRRFAVGGNR